MEGEYEIAGLIVHNMKYESLFNILKIIPTVFLHCDLKRNIEIQDLKTLLLIFYLVLVPKFLIPFGSKYMHTDQTRKVNF